MGLSKTLSNTLASLSARWKDHIDFDHCYHFDWLGKESNKKEKHRCSQAEARHSGSQSCDVEFSVLICKWCFDIESLIEEETCPNTSTTYHTSKQG